MDLKGFGKKKIDEYYVFVFFKINLGSISFFEDYKGYRLDFWELFFIRVFKRFIIIDKFILV